jgi:hypothetical protein
LYTAGGASLTKTEQQHVCVVDSLKKTMVDKQYEDQLRYWDLASAKKISVSTLHASGWETAVVAQQEERRPRFDQPGAEENVCSILLGLLLTNKHY